jgi:uncharacterized protein involved in tolerance to divalent cations
VERYPELEMRLKSLHPYEVPEIIAIPVVGRYTGLFLWLLHPLGPSLDARREAGSTEYLAWLTAATGGRAQE